MPIDRLAILRNAEKLLRQGKLDAAIAEYLRVVEEDPRDWNTANALGDLYARAGQIDKAVEQFMQIADSLNNEGGVAKAGAVYKKVLKLKPVHEQALWHVSDILASQGLYADARAHLTTLIELRRGRGDVRGALQAKIRLGSLDPADYESRLTAASARIEMGDKAGALRDLKEIADELADKGRQTEAISVLREAAKLNPDDEEIQGKLLDVFFAAGDFVHARECATSVEQFRLIAAALEGQGKSDEAVDTLRQAAAAHPEDTELSAEVARAFIARGDVATAAEYLTVETAGNDPKLLLTVADMRLRGEEVEEGMAIIRGLLDQDASRREQIALLGWAVAEQRPDAGFLVVELAANTAVAENDWPGAAAVLQEFVTRVPNHIPALMHLVEICVDGGLEATMYSAQAQLADAYIATGAAMEARFISEDLVAREPWEKANIERFRRALVLLGEPDPDALIASRLSGESPFTSTDMSFGGDDAGLFEAPLPAAQAAAEAAAAAEVEHLLAAVAEAEAPAKKTAQRPRRRVDEEHHFELSANAIDLESILGEFDAPAAPVHAEPEAAEVDLSVVLEDIKPTATPAKAAAAEDLDGVFGNLRDQASKRTGLNEAEKEYKRGLALRAAGDIDGCIQALEQASRAPKLRFATAWLIARLYRDRGMTAETLEWLERSAQAPAHTSSDAHQVLYELAEALESSGEQARALAICLELQAEAGDYNDVAARIDRLSKVQTRG
ncbi:MAG TPA: tetratricopeptide repeat protein [Vicinamibacterales bacterium]|nr:tetratricopeptide repeat protein [Vicinamibacterales bacterium]